MHGHTQTYPSSSCLLQASINTHAVICVSFKTGDRLVLSLKAWLCPLLSLPPLPRPHLCTGRWLSFKERPKSHDSRCISPRYDSKRLCWDGLKLNLIKTTIYTCPFTVSEVDTWALRIRAGNLGCKRKRFYIDRLPGSISFVSFWWTLHLFMLPCTTVSFTYFTVFLFTCFKLFRKC